MNKYLIILFALLTAAGAEAQKMRPNRQYEDYIEQYKDLAIQQMLKYKIPASITLAQGLLESGAGKSELAVRGNNHFGIKCHGWAGRTVYHDDDEQGECFRAYDDPYQSFEDHSQFLLRDRYKSLFSLRLTDYKGWAQGLKRCGYATSPTYATKLIQLIDLYGLNEYDHAKKYDKFMAQKVSKDKPAQIGQPLHPIHIYNKNYYLFARKGDTFKDIGKEVGISYKKIAKRNERYKDDVLHEGDIVYLKKKQKRALKQFKNQPHTVKSGESLYDIAQMYGIRLKSLYKMNHLKADYEIAVGDKLRVR